MLAVTLSLTLILTLTLTVTLALTLTLTLTWRNTCSPSASTRKRPHRSAPISRWPSSIRVAKRVRSSRCFLSRSFLSRSMNSSDVMPIRQPITTPTAALVVESTRTCRSSHCARVRPAAGRPSHFAAVSTALPKTVPDTSDTTWP